MPPHSWPEAFSQQRLQVRPEDILDAAHAGGFQNGRRRSLFTAKAVTKGFERHVKTNFVAVLEAIGDGLRYGRNAHRHSFNDVTCLPVLECITGEADHAK